MSKVEGKGEKDGVQYSRVIKDGKRKKDVQYLGRDNSERKGERRKNNHDFRDWKR